MTPVEARVRVGIAVAGALSEEEILRHLDRAGFDRKTIMINSERFGDHFKAFVSVKGPDGEPIVAQTW